MSIFDSAKEFLGLGPYGEDDAYYDDAYDRDDRDDRVGTDMRDDRGDRRAQSAHAAHEVRDVRDVEPSRAHRYSSAADRDYAEPRVRREAQVVIPMLHSYQDAKQVGEPFRDGNIVIMDLTSLSKVQAKAFIDFSSGLCMALRGTMHNLTSRLDVDRRVFAIVPDGVDVDEQDLQRRAHLI